MNTREYRNAPGGIGPQAFQWKDKPHRLIYDLCKEVERLQAINDELLAACKNIPNPEDEGYCDSCGKRLELEYFKLPGNDLPYCRFKHDGCWYGKIQELIHKAEQGAGP